MGLCCLLASDAMAADQLECLAKNIYHEARGESLEGQLAIAKVTLKRVQSDKYPNSICEVVYQPGAFSWTKENKGEKEEVMVNMRLVAELGLKTYDSADWSADHYHNDSVQPSWASKLIFVCQIGNHKFYKEK
jgi:spore germination cell wall hydrolase CwlJ-like protein